MSNELRIDRDLFIPTRDGESLAATVCVPSGAGPFPTLLTMSPYHKEGFTWAHHESPSQYFAERGYATVLVDFRGTGGSTGKVSEMMDPREGLDAVDAVEWIAAQEWCDGNVGMWGVSYGGVVSLKAAAEKPVALKAIAPIMAGTDAYHQYFFPGGCSDLSFSYGAYGNWMAAMNLMPPSVIDPDGHWYEVWMQRLKQNRPWMLAWWGHQNYDSYWQSRAVSVQSITTPTFLVGGWQDMFRDGMPSIYEALDCPKRLLMGPWMHLAPDLAPHQPVDYLAELSRWFDRWLKLEKNGIEDELPVRVHVGGVEEWRELPDWPPRPTARTTLYATSEGRLDTHGGQAEAAIPYTVVPSVGVASGRDWDPGEMNVGWPSDQGVDDLRSLTFTTEPLAAAVAFMGKPEAIVRVTIAEGTDTQLIVRLNDVGADGTSTLITRGHISLRHRDSTSSPKPIVVGETYDVGIPLDATAYCVQAGHRLRIAVSGSDFPRTWPSVSNSVLELHVGGQRGTSIVLPEVSLDEWAAMAPRRPDAALNTAPSVIEGAPRYSIVHDHVAGAIAVNEGFVLRMNLPSGGTLSVDSTVVSRVADEFPEGACVEGLTTIQAELPSVGTVQVTATSRASRPGVVVNTLVKLNGMKIDEQSWTA